MIIPGVERRIIAGEERLATPGDAVYGEPVVDGWRAWGAGRSKLAAMLERGLEIDVSPPATVLYLGAGAGTTVSHLADICPRVYAIEFAPRPARQLRDVAEDRPAIIPLLKDVRAPETYAHVVEANCDVLVQDVATRDQAGVAVANRPFLADDGHIALAIKARSEDVTADPEDVYEDVIDRLSPTYDVIDHVDLAPYHTDHLGLVARPR